MVTLMNSRDNTGTKKLTKLSLPMATVKLARYHSKIFATIRRNSYRCKLTLKLQANFYNHLVMQAPLYNSTTKARMQKKS